MMKKIFARIKRKNFKANVLNNPIYIKPENYSDAQVWIVNRIDSLKS
jgi:hypothetical protein